MVGFRVGLGMESMSSDRKDTDRLDRIDPFDIPVRGEDELVVS